MKKTKFKFYTIALIALLSLDLFANSDKNETVVKEPVRKSHNVPNATNSKDPLLMNTPDWENLSKAQGVDSSLAGNSQDMAGKLTGVGLVQDIGSITNTYIQNNEAYKENKNLTAYTNDFQASIIEKASAGKMGAKGELDKIRCYITRDIPFRYTCSITGIMYGGAVSENAVVARDNCKAECYESKTCADVTPDTNILKTIKLNDISGNSNGNKVTSTATVDKSRRADRIEFKTNAINIADSFYVDVTYIDNKGKNKELVKSLYSTTKDEPRKFYINDIATEVTVSAYAKEGSKTTISVSVKDIEVIYKSSQKFICPTLQDISNEKPENFAKLCPSGKIHRFNKGVTSYMICEDYGVLGDNADGTFSTNEACKATCKESGSCTPDTSVFSNDILKNFREGCILGQANCKDEYCTLARKKNDQVLNEIFFDAGNKPIVSIENSVQKRGIKRPRISLSDDQAHEKRNIEEWKDKAYEHMMRENTFNLTQIPIGTNTPAMNAYGIGMIDGADYGVAGTSTRTINWKVKPASFDVSNDKTYKLYAIVIATVGKKVWGERGQRVLQQDRVWFIKTSNSDTFKPFYREDDIGAAGVNLSDTNNTEGAYFSDNPYVKKTFQSFSEQNTATGGTWHGVSQTLLAEYFMTNKFTPTQMPYWTFTVVNQLGNLVNELKGLIRSRTTDLHERPVYKGNFDGSGEGMLAFTVATAYSERALTYQQIVDRVSSGEIPTIYHSNAPYLYPKDIKSDAMNSNSSLVQIYQYGQSNKQTAYMEIRPRKEDVAKKGFIYVFIY